MGLSFYIGEVQAQANQTSRMNNHASQAIASLQTSIQSFLSAPLSSKAYDSAKSYFMVAYTPLCQSAIMTGEALESANKRLLSDYQSMVCGMDTIEDQILEQIARFEDVKRDIEQQMSTAKTMRPDLERRYINACETLEKRQEKLRKFHEYNAHSATIFSDYEACEAEFSAGLTQVANCKAWNPATGTFDMTRLNMSWAKPIHNRWEKREKMRQEKLKNAKSGKANTLAKHGLTESDLVQVTDSPELVYQKYIKFSKLGLNPHTGKLLTHREKLQFQYAAHSGTLSDLIGLVGGAYAGQKASDAGFYKNNTGANRLLKPELLEELAKSGVKYNLDDIVMIGRDSSGKLLWLENGSDKAGLKHIINGHVADFSAQGIKDIPNFLHDTLKLDPIKQGTGPKGPYSVYNINGQRYTLAYGNNGFVVSFYPSK